MWRRTWLVFSQAVTVALAVLFVLLTLKPEWLPRSAASGMLPAPTLVQMVAAPAAMSPLDAASAPDGRPVVFAFSHAAAARLAAPAVVSISATRLANRNPHADDPRLRPFSGGGNGRPQQQLGLGSAVIVAPEGYLLTNHHVVEDAVEIDVALADGRSARARVVGSDPETDIAVLKIDLPNLPVITLGDTRSLQVGDAVLAIGNPFNVGQTVTAGIVSALERTRASPTAFQNFIQTDAAINPGNSGGALVDARGALVGINTAIFSRDGGSLGIGFAVPVDTARAVMEALIREGSVRRGWLGVEMQDISAELADSLGLPVSSGALVTGVLQQGPASRGGLLPGDVVVRVDQAPVATAAQLLAAVARLAPDSRATLGVQRGDKALDVAVSIGTRPPPERRR